MQMSKIFILFRVRHFQRIFLIEAGFNIQLIVLSASCLMKIAQVYNCSRMKWKLLLNMCFFMLASFARLRYLTCRYKKWDKLVKEALSFCEQFRVLVYGSGNLVTKQDKKVIFNFGMLRQPLPNTPRHFLVSLHILPPRHSQTFPPLTRTHTHRDTHRHTHPNRSSYNQCQHLACVFREESL